MEIDKIKKSGLLQLVGNTALIKLESLSQLAENEIYLKCETQNPGGTVKDRPALYMIAEAIKRGDLKEGMTIVEGTAGNTGIGLAMVGSALGFPVKVVMPEGADPMKHKILGVYGAEVNETPVVPFSDERHFFRAGKKLGTSSPDFWWSNQFDNPDNYLSHYKTTGPEIYQQTKGEITHFVTAAGSSGTIAGISRYLKEQNEKINITLVDPDGSTLYSHFHTGKHDILGEYTMAEGVGITRDTENYLAAKLDNALKITDQYFTSLAYYLREHEGLVMGMSSMLNLAGAFKVALEAPKGSKIVTMMCDGADRAISKLYSKEFLKTHKLDSSVLSHKELKKLFVDLKT